MDRMRNFFQVTKLKRGKRKNCLPRRKKGGPQSKKRGTRGPMTCNGVFFSRKGFVKGIKFKEKTPP